MMVITRSKKSERFSIVQECPYLPLTSDEYAPIKKRTKIIMLTKLGYFLLLRGSYFVRNLNPEIFNDVQST